MPIVASEENVFALAMTPEHVPDRRGGRKLHVSTPFRWAKNGVRGVRLETIRIGGTLCTSAEALQRFFERLSATDDAPTDSPNQGHAAPLAVRTASVRQKAVVRADKELAALGV